MKTKTDAEQLLKEVFMTLATDGVRRAIGDKPYQDLFTRIRDHINDQKKTTSPKGTK